MTKLEELINELCPDGVEYKRIDELCIITRGRVMSKDYIRNNVGQYPVYSSQTENNGELGKISTYDFEGEYLTWTTDGANAGSVFYRNGKFSVTNVCGLLKVKVDEITTKYLYHILSITAPKYVNKGMGNPKLMSNVMARIKVPLPPLSIQSEIVHILDSFTLLTAELTARQKQYAFYRDYLLDFSDEDVTKKIPDIDCSNVEYKRLGDISNIIRGGNFQKKDFVEQGKPCIHYGQIYTRLGTTTSKSITYLNDDVYSKSKKAMLNDIIMAVTSENIEDVCKCTVWVGNKDVAVSGHTAIIHPSINSKYLGYYFQTKMFFKQKKKLAHGTKVIEVTPDKLNDILIPVPPLSVQENIVKILDRFDKLNNDMSEGLPAEIEARKKQYEYYRDTLLSFDDKACSHIVKVERERELTRTKAIKWLKLGEIGKVRMCKRILKSQTNTQFGVPFYKIGTFGKKADAYVSNELFNEYKSKYSYPKKGDILISCSGTIGKTVVFNGEPAYFQDSNIVWLENDESVVLNTYLKYCYDRQPWRAESGGTIARLYNANIENAVIPVPPLEEQERIVSILDRFDKLCNDISEGLPAEIEARQKQYEYYRDKLLMFKRVEANEK